MAVNQKISPQLVGYTPSNPASTTTVLGLTAAATWLALGFVPDAGKTLNAVRVFLNTVTGSLAASDLTCDIFSDTSGAPNVSLASSATVTPAAASATWIDFTGFSLALTAGVQYWIVLKNVNATPASNSPSYKYGATGAGTGLLLGGTSTIYGWVKTHSTNSGGAWGTTVYNTLGYRLAYSDGSFAGEPISAITGTVAANAVFTTREIGAVLVVPPGVTWNVRGAVFPVNRTGTPGGSLRYRLYNNTTLLATSYSIAVGNVVTTAVCWMAAYFAADQVIPAGTTLRIAIGTTTGGDGSNCYRTLESTVNNDANSKALFAFGNSGNPTGAVKKTLFDGSTWTDTDTLLTPFALILDSDGEYVRSGTPGIIMAS